jgi:hypothetical protein
MKNAPTIEQLKVNDLIPYAKNSRTHSEEQVGQIAASIREFGFTNPVLIDKEGTIVAGHGRVMAARKLGMESVPCIRLGHLSPAPTSSPTTSWRSTPAGMRKCSPPKWPS